MFSARFLCLQPSVLVLLLNSVTPGGRHWLRQNGFRGHQIPALLLVVLPHLVIQVSVFLCRQVLWSDLSSQNCSPRTCAPRLTKLTDTSSVSANSFTNTLSGSCKTPCGSGATLSDQGLACGTCPGRQTSCRPVKLAGCAQGLWCTYFFFRWVIHSTANVCNTGPQTSCREVSAAQETILVQPGVASYHKWQLVGPASTSIKSTEQALNKSIALVLADAAVTVQVNASAGFSHASPGSDGGIADSLVGFFSSAVTFQFPGTWPAVVRTPRHTPKMMTLLETF